MKKRKLTMQEALKKAAPVLQRRYAEADEMVQAISKEMMQDQVAWLDKQMQDILPPNLYEAGKRGELETLIGEYMREYQIRIIFIPDRLVLRIMIGDKVHSQFVPELTCDGEKVDWEPVKGVIPEQN